MKFILLFLAIFISLYLVTYKISIIVRAIAFTEYEKNNEAVISFILMILTSILWAIFFSIY